MRLLFVTIVCALATAWPNPASARRLMMDYQGVAYGFLNFGRARIELEIDEKRYESRVRLRANGLAALFTDASLEAESSGVWKEAGASPRVYRLDHVHGGGTRLATVKWDDPGVAVSASPPFSEPGNPAPTEAQRRQGRDPLATLLSMAASARESPCAGTFRVFDGLYVYDLTLSYRSEAVVTRQGVSQRVLKCGLKQRRIAGYAKPGDLEKRTPAGEIWFAIEPDQPIAIPLRVVSRLPLGLATIRLVSVTESGERAP